MEQNTTESSTNTTQETFKTVQIFLLNAFMPLSVYNIYLL